MAFKLTISTNSTSSDGNNIILSDSSIWAEADFPRINFGVFVLGKYQINETPVEVIPETYAALTSVEWTAPTIKDGRYLFTAYAFLVEGFGTLSEGDVRINATDGLLYKNVQFVWEPITLEEAILEEKYHYVSDVLDVPFLAHAYSFRNYLNLEYIKQVKSDVSKGAQQNKLYYQRTTLDYFYALILGAEYNWALGLYSNYYEIVNNLTDIINTKQLS